MGEGENTWKQTPSIIDLRRKKNLNISLKEQVFKVVSLSYGIKEEHIIQWNAKKFLK